jgi:ADP-ribose pyrophosphatase
MNTPQTLCETRYLRLVERDGWSFVQRTNVCGVVCIAALTAQNELILVEQYRKPINANVIELPAGLAGDQAEYLNEPLVNAARRELLEETGFEADHFQQVLVAPTSAGLTDETITFFVATHARKVADGGGDEHEQISTYCIPLHKLDDWLNEQVAHGKLIDAKLMTGVYLLARAIA